MSEEKEDNVENRFLVETGEDLFNYALEREDTKWILSSLPSDSEIDYNTLEYELQTLKIISVGWAFAYYIQDAQTKDFLSRAYWEAIRDFCANLSQSTGMLIGQDVDYFQVIKERVDAYVQALNKEGDEESPAKMIGPVFAGFCGNSEDIFCLYAGGKMFIGALDRVKEYLGSRGLISPED